MALRVGPRGTEGCCECSAFIGCDCATETAGLECRVRGGGALLIGFEEFIDPSTPPRKYRRKEYSGSASSNVYADGSNCTGAVQSTVNCTLSGACQYNATTGALTQNALQACNGIPVGAGCSLDPVQEVCGRDTSVSRTLKTSSPVAECCDDQIATGDNYRIELSDEDTEEDAIDRAVAGGWSEWSPVDEFCQNPGCCQSAYEERVSGFGFVYIEAEFKVKKTGLTPGQAYDIAVDIYRRPYDSGPYELYATIELSATVDGSGILETNATAVPNDLGFQTYASSPARLTPVS